MPNLTQDRNSGILEIDDLKTYYNSCNPFLRFLLIPSLWGASLETQKTPLEIFRLVNNVYVQGVSKIFNYLFSTQLTFFSSSRVKAWQFIQHHALLNDDSSEANFNVVANQRDGWGAALSLRIIHRAGLLDLNNPEAAQANRDIIAGHETPMLLATALEILYEIGLFYPGNQEASQINFSTVTTHHDPHIFLGEIQYLHYEVGLLVRGNPEVAQANFDDIMGHKDPRAVASALITLDKAGLLDSDNPDAQANRAAVVGHKTPVNAASALITLHENGLLNSDNPGAQANRTAVVGHQDSVSAASALRITHKVGLLDLDNPEAAQNRATVTDPKKNVNSLATALTRLHEAGLLTPDNPDSQANFNAIMGHQDPKAVASALIMFHEAGFLDTDNPDAQANRSAVVDHQTPMNAASALITLDKAGLMGPDNLDAAQNRAAVVGHKNPKAVTSALRIIHEAGLLNPNKPEATQANRVAVSDPEKNVYALILPLARLQSDGLLNPDNPDAQANFDAVVAHKQQENAAYLLCKLFKVGLLDPNNPKTTQNRAVALGHAKPEDVHDALVTLADADGIKDGSYNNRKVTQAEFDFVVSHEQPKDVGFALEILHITEVLDLNNPEAAHANSAAVAGNIHPRDVASALIILHEAGLLDPNMPEAAQANRAVVAGSGEKSRRLSGLLKALNKSGLMDPNDLDIAQANFDAVIEHQNLVGFSQAFYTLRGSVANFLGRDNPERAQADFDSFIQYIPILLGSEDARTIWPNIPGHLLTERHWNTIIELCEANHDTPEVGATAFVRYVNQQILRVGAVQPGAPRNDNQSTHKASIHLSSSQSAKRLQERYQATINQQGLDVIIEQIKAWVHAQPSDIIEKRDDELEEEMKLREKHWINAAAKRCFDKLTAYDYSFTDPASQVSTRQLLALTWVAIHDEDKRGEEVELSDAEDKYLEGLYDAQRIYNLAEHTFIDNMARDLPACASGTFNKLLEKLISIHPDVVQSYITKTGAADKLQKLVPIVVREHLKKLPLIEVIDEDSLWSSIQQDVAEQLFFEFGSLYTSSELSDAFNTIALQYKTTFQEFAESHDYEDFKGLMAQNASHEFNELIKYGEYVSLSEVINEHLRLRSVSSDSDEKEGHQLSSDDESERGYEEMKGLGEKNEDEVDTHYDIIPEADDVERHLSKEEVRQRRLTLFDTPKAIPDESEPKLKEDASKKHGS